MIISYIEHKSMELFHKNNEINVLVSLCMNYCDTTIIDDILALISISTIDIMYEYLEILEIRYINSYLYDIFLKFKQCILLIFDNKHMKNLKGAFLEVLTLAIFEKYYPNNKHYTDCNVCINDWSSDKTVDIVMECDNSALICECKIPSSKFSWNIFKNLLNIKNNSNGYFSIFISTLANKNRMKNKKQKIINVVDECESLDEIHFITREFLVNLNLN